jgi:hypothetical protein
MGSTSVPDLLGGILPASKVHFNTDLDIAAISLHLPINTNTGKQLRMPAVPLNPALPTIGQHCFAFGYHSMRWDQANDGKHTHSVLQSYSASRWLIEEIHASGRDKHLSFPCFRTSSRFDGGMSGGPVLDEKGNVVGIVCSSFGNADNEGYISYASLAGSALMLQIDVDVGGGVIEKRLLHDLAKAGIVAAADTLKGIALVQERETLKLSFGKPAQ